MSLQLSARLRCLYPGTYQMWCPGCYEHHVLVIGSRQEFDKRLGFDGDLRAPSFEPRIRVSTDRGLCTFELRGGHLTFDINSHHDLAGKSVPLPTLPPTQP